MKVLKKMIFCSWLCCQIILIISQKQNAYAQSFGFQPTNGLKIVEIPFESYNNLIVIPVILNNKIPLKFILDSGVGTAILTERTYSDLLNISYNRKISLYGSGSQKIVEAYVANNISLTLPGVVGKGQALLVLDEDYLQLKNNLGTEVHGIIGYEIFSRFIVKIDYDLHIITLYEPEAFKPSRIYRSVPITIENTKPYLTGSITYQNNKKVEAKLLIDTGASHALMLDPDAYDSVDLPKKQIEVNLGRGLGGNIAGTMGRIAMFQLERFQFKNVIASFPEESGYSDVAKSTGRHGTIGGEMLNRFVIIFDYFGQRMYFRRGRYFNEGFELNMSGIDLIAVGPKLNNFEVTAVVKNSAAWKADIRKGDLIISVNGKKDDFLMLNSILKLFRRKEGRKIRLKIQRGNQELKRTLVLERLI